MSNFRSRATVFFAGAVTVVVILVALVAADVLPVKTETTTVLQQSATGNVPTALTSSSALTPEQIYNKYSPGVVEVISTFPASSSGLGFFGQSTGPSQALGSGFVVSRDGYVLTNAHVVQSSGQNASSVTVVFKGQGTQTKNVTAKIVGVDPTSDVAVLKVDPAQAPALVPLVLGNSSAVLVGEPVVAIGNPLGYDFSLTSGIVSATNRDLQSPNGSTIANGIQTDAAINEGNSGGPLIDSSGRVIGINEQIASQSGGNQGLGFAVPINTAVSVMNQIEKTGKVTYAYLGIEGQTITSDIARALGLKQTQGVLVAAVAPNSPAAKAGIKGGSTQTVIQGQPFVTGGDVITAIDGKTVTTMDQLAATIAAHKPGDKVTLTIVAGSTTRQVTATLATRPTNS
ncbi:MAG: S1C family serine protease [Thermoleophilia bacterium]